MGKGHGSGSRSGDGGQKWGLCGLRGDRLGGGDTRVGMGPVRARDCTQSVLLLPLLLNVTSCTKVYKYANDFADFVFGIRHFGRSAFFPASSRLSRPINI